LFEAEASSWEISVYYSLAASVYMTYFDTIPMTTMTIAGRDVIKVSSKDSIKALSPVSHEFESPFNDYFSYFSDALVNIIKKRTMMRNIKNTKKKPIYLNLRIPSPP
jgi:hypothetical protein